MLGLGGAVCSATAEGLPLAVTFRGKDKFDEIVAKAKAQNWAAKPIGQRMTLIALELNGQPYVGYTLEIDDHVEAASANLTGLDCWTFFEAVLGIARMLERPAAKYTPQDLLAEIQWTRYRGGKCTGSYLERIHYLNEWYLDNAARGNITDLTATLGVDVPLVGRESREMSVLWKGYRYLRNNPELRPKMSALEAEISALPVRYIPKAKVKSIEGKLRNGDIIGIVSKGQGGVCSHVGIILRPTSDGATHFMHASSNFHKVTVDETISTYLATYTSNLGILVGRPLPTSQTVRDPAVYQTNLERLKRG